MLNMKEKLSCDGSVLVPNSKNQNPYFMIISITRFAALLVSNDRMLNGDQSYLLAIKLVGIARMHDDIHQQIYVQLSGTGDGDKRSGLSPGR